MLALCHARLESAIGSGETDAVTAGSVEVMDRAVLLALLQGMVGRMGRVGVEAHDAKAAMWAAQAETIAIMVMRTARVTDCGRSPCSPGDPGCR